MLQYSVHAVDHPGSCGRAASTLALRGFELMLAVALKLTLFLAPLSVKAVDSAKAVEHAETVEYAKTVDSGLATIDAPRRSYAKKNHSDKKLERCVYLNSKIERYTRLRRSGADAMRMESWRQSRERYATEFRDRRCHRYGRKLRRSRKSKVA